VDRLILEARDWRKYACGCKISSPKIITGNAIATLDYDFVEPIQFFINFGDEIWQDIQTRIHSRNHHGL